jgi:hypothetical protein
MADDEFMNDAIEGLENFKNKKDVSLMVQQLNSELKKQTAKKKARKEKRKLKDQPWLYITIVTLLILVIVAYIVIKKHLNS